VIAATSRCRSCLVPRRDNSLLADGLIRTSYPATAPHRLDDGLERHGGLAPTLPGRLEVRGILREGSAQGLVDDLGDGAVSRRSLKAQGAMDLRVEVDSGAAGGGHDAILAFCRLDVKTSVPELLDMATFPPALLAGGSVTWPGQSVVSGQ
jgi:hypothetical protein